MDQLHHFPLQRIPDSSAQQEKFLLEHSEGASIPQEVRDLMNLLLEKLKLPIFFHRNNHSTGHRCHNIIASRNISTPYPDIEGVLLRDEIRTSAKKVHYTDNSSESVLLHTRAHVRLSENKVRQVIADIHPEKTIKDIQPIDEHGIEFGKVTPFSRIEWLQIFDESLLMDIGMPLTTNAHDHNFSLEIPVEALRLLIAQHIETMYIRPISARKQSERKVLTNDDNSDHLIDLRNIERTIQGAIGVIGGNPPETLISLLQNIQTLSRTAVIANSPLVDDRKVHGGDFQSPSTFVASTPRLGRSMAFPRGIDDVKQEILQLTRSLLERGASRLALWCFTNTIFENDIIDLVNRYKENQQAMLVEIEAQQPLSAIQQALINEHRKHIESILYISLVDSTLQSLENILPELREKSPDKNPVILVFGGDFAMSADGSWRNRLEEFAKKHCVDFVFRSTQDLMFHIKSVTGQGGKGLKETITTAIQKAHATAILPLSTELIFAIRLMQKELNGTIILDTTECHATSILDS